MRLSETAKTASLSIWYKASGLSERGQSSQLLTFTNSNGKEWFFWGPAVSAELTFSFTGKDNGSYGYANFGRYTQNAWTHLVFCVQNENNQSKIIAYVNGVKQEIDQGGDWTNSLMSLLNIDTFAIGGYAPMLSNPHSIVFYGSVDEIGLYSGVLTADEASYLYHSVTHVPAYDANAGLPAIMTSLFYENADISESAVLPYRLYVPDNYSAEKSYSLLVWMHGAGERGSDNTYHITADRNQTRLMERILNDEALREQFIIVAPQCPTTDKWVDTDWYQGLYNIAETPQTVSSQLVMSLLQDELTEQYHIDADRIYISGISMGGYATWDLICRYPDYFAAAIPVCGGVDLSYAETICHIPIWTAHSQEDPVVLPVGTDKMVEKLTALGADITYTVTDPYAHGAWTPLYQEADIVTWLTSKTRKGQEEITSDVNSGSDSETDRGTESESSSATTANVDKDEPKATVLPWIICSVAVLVAVFSLIFAFTSKKKK